MAYVGSGEDVRRIQRQQAEREAGKKKFEDQKKQSDVNVEVAGLRQFGAGQSEMLENAFKVETVGLVTKAEFLSKRNTLRDRLEEEQKRSKRAATEAAHQEKDDRQKKKAKLAAMSKLSFLGEDEDDVADAGGPSAHGVAAADPAAVPPQHRRFAKLGKDPRVQTDFLPDKDREVEEEELREKLKLEWSLRQRLIKNEPLEITYSYWDGTGHRRKVVVKKGDSIGDLLKACRDQGTEPTFGVLCFLQLAPEFRELKGTSTSNLIYVKEDLIIPNQYTFYDLIINKARGKSGPLFHFDVHEDVRLQSDARIEKDESHAGKVVERHWYSRNKHIFPASRWETYNPEDTYDTYTTHGSEVS